MARRDNQLAARALAHWAREGFREAHAARITETYGVTVRTLWNWKAALDTDSELAGLFKQRLDDILNRDWAAELDAALAETVERLRALIQASDDLTAVVDAFKALSEVAITREVLRAGADAESDSGYAASRGANADDRAPLTN